MRVSITCTPAGTDRAAISLPSTSASVGVVAQRQGVRVVVNVVGVGVGHVADGGLGLHPDEVDEVVDSESGLGGVGHLPHHDGGDLDRVAVGVVDLGDRRLVVANAGGHFLAIGQRVDPAQAVRADRADVTAEQLQHAPGQA